MPTPQKRSAAEIHNGRPAKRQATYSPEEGELDDATVAPKATEITVTRPEVIIKVDYPFKKKASTTSKALDNEDEEKRVPAIYVRSEEDEKRIREQEERDRRENGARRPDSNKRKLIDRIDSWKPEEDSSYDRDRYGHYEPVRRTQHSKGYDSYQPTYDDHKSWQRDRDRPKSPHRGRTLTPLSPSRSHSSRSSSGRRGKHRLPPHGTTYADTVPSPRFSPRSPARYDHSPIRYYERDARDQYFRDDDDNFYRPNYSYDDRERDRYIRRSYTPDRRSGSRGKTPLGYPSHMKAKDSPIQSRPLSPLKSPPHSSSRSPPPPPSSPPPIPVDNLLPKDHRAVHIMLKRPGAPLESRSPPSLQFLSAKRDKASPVKSKPMNDALIKEAKERAVTRKQKPSRRTREEEKEAYNRVFVGCGQKDDYDITTKLGEGTFGEVHKAISKARKITVAIKRILMHNEKEGMPVTALREIKILKAMKHSCIIELLDMFVVPSENKSTPMSVYMVFPYMDHDLAGLLANERVKLQPSQIKLYMKQLLEGTEYMHHNKILHRDMKAANLLIDNTGCLRIADFGLARLFDPKIVTRAGKFSKYGHERKYTNCVVTRWYRPPELLLGARQYGGEVDVWGIGCILGEMFWRRPILTGNSDLDQLEKIWNLCGSPNQQNWPDFDKLPGCEGQIRFNATSRKLKSVYETIGKETCDLLDKLLTLDPRERITASEALDHDYFWSDPLPADPKTLPIYESSHEFDQRGRYNAAPPAPGMGHQPPKMPGGANMHRPNLPPPLHNRQRNYQQRQQQQQFQQFQHYHHHQQQQQHRQPQPAAPPHTHQLPTHQLPAHQLPSHPHPPHPHPPHTSSLPPPPPNLPPPPLPPISGVNHSPPPPPDATSRGWSGPPGSYPHPPTGNHHQNPYRPAPPYGSDNSRMHNSFLNGRGQMPGNPFRAPTQPLSDRPAHLPPRPLAPGLPLRPDFNSQGSRPIPRGPSHNSLQHQRHSNGSNNGGGLNYG